MNIKEIFQNPWTKRIGIAVPIAIGGIAIAKRQQEKNQWDKIKQESGVSTSSNASQPGKNVTPSIDNTVDLRSESGIQYSSNTLIIGSNRYQFTMPGVKKLQKYLSKASKTAARHIAMAGGTDGKIGRGFIKALNAYVSEFPGTKPRAYSEMLKKSGFKPGEMTKI